VDDTKKKHLRRSVYSCTVTARPDLCKDFDSESLDCIELGAWSPDERHQLPAVAKV
jgi:hypothetical protein